MSVALPQRGFSLIEIVLFIAIAGIVASVLVQVFGLTGRDPHLGKTITQATDLAQQRMEIIAGQRRALGYTTFQGSPDYDPCKSGVWSGTVCTGTSYANGSFTVTSTVPMGCGTDCVQVTVTVTDPYGATAAVLTRQFWNY